VERDHFEDMEVDGRIILKLIFKKLVRGYGLDLTQDGAESFLRS
jgi:hypothetical protein